MSTITIPDVPLAIYLTGFMFTAFIFLKIHIRRPVFGPAWWHHATISDLIQAAICGLFWPIIAVIWLWIGPEGD